MNNRPSIQRDGDTAGTSKEIITYLATVRYAFPWMNLYVVSPIKRSKNINLTELVSGQDRLYGNTHTAYNIGDIVMVNSDRNNPDSWSLTDYIAGIAAPDNLSDSTTEEIPSDDINKHSVWYLLRHTFDKLKQMFPSKRMDAVKTYVKYNEHLPGETHITTTPDVGIHALKHIIQIQCGKRNMVELDSVLNRVRIVTEKLEYIGPLRCCQDLSGTGSLLKYEQEALTQAEGSAYTDKQPYALYRNRSVAGDITMGWSDAISVPDLYTHSTNDVFRRKVNYDGRLELTSAKGFSFKKSLDVVSVIPITEDHTILDKTTELDPTIVAAMHDNSDTKKDIDVFFDRTINIRGNIDTNRAEEFFHTNSNNEAWATTDSTRSPELSKAVKDANSRKLQPIGTSQYYDLPDVVHLTDPHTGESYTYYKADSGIIYEPDGSLVLYDGYGSEIRMTRGNIIISPAADLIMRPGRDTHVMSGRHTALVSQKDVTIHSSLSDVYIKAQNDIQIISGIDKEGVITIENRGMGINVRATTNAALTGKDVFVGSIPDSTPDSLNGFVDGDGTVTIGAGKQTNIIGGVVATKCDEFSVIVNEKSFLTVALDTVAISSATICINGKAHFGYAVGSYSIAIRGTTYNLSSANSSEVICAVPVYSNHSLMCDYIQSNYGEFRLLLANNADGDTNMRPRTAIKEVSWPGSVSEDIQLISVTAPTIPEDVDKNIFVYGNTFKYPSSDEIGLNKQYIIPGMLWQSITSTGLVWKELPIPGLRDKDPNTMVYPGLEIWSNASVTVPGYGKKNINGGYVING